MLRLVLADAELELVPGAIAGHPALRRYAQRRGRAAEHLLLDSSVAHPALRGMPEGDRRGRPDIVHLFLLVCLDSRLNLRGELETAIHTRHDAVISVSAKTRLPKNYNRFLGLVEALFERGAVPSTEEPLLQLEHGVPLRTLLERSPGPRVGLTEDAPREDPVEVFRETGPQVTCVVGGFPHGGFRSPMAKLVDRRISLEREPLKVWTVASELTTAYARVGDEQATG